MIFPRVLVSALLLAVARWAPAHAQVFESLDVCPVLVSRANAAVGVGAIEDRDCLHDRSLPGCFAQICRFCQHEPTEQSKFFVPCDPAKRPVPETGELELTSSDCAAAVSSGDSSVGISAFFDATCPRGLGNGVGCLPTSCRLCKTWDSPQSGHLVPCSSADACAVAVARSGQQDMDYVSDRRCLAASGRPMGCVQGSNCRLCRRAKNEGNQYYDRCDTLRSLQRSAARRLADDLMPVLPVEAKGDDAETGEHDKMLPLVVAAGGVVAAVVVLLAAMGLRKMWRQRRHADFETPRSSVADVFDKSSIAQL
ncbi:hypothetical protein P43SY_005503 [Pythium insidiosum]|uniref:TNFR-Cys domain-containing protein n=1 Tax=Pythium insidiosum TaxID=114742 RepID=A0AAD5LLY2_PYTIN|nr:hypothetical protein P43SY_005503 [Pythium insidiosum]